MNIVYKNIIILFLCFLLIDHSIVNILATPDPNSHKKLLKSSY